MNHPFKKNSKLVLSNGITFPGYSFGAKGTIMGEIVFNTGMTGYQEVITDPSYFGQILTFTYPEIGNTGINFEDSESNTNVNFELDSALKILLDNGVPKRDLAKAVSLITDIPTNEIYDKIKDS